MRQRMMLLTINVSFMEVLLYSVILCSGLINIVWPHFTLNCTLCFVTLLQMIISRNCFRGQLDACWVVAAIQMSLLKDTIVFFIIFLELQNKSATHTNWPSITMLSLLIALVTLAESLDLLLTIHGQIQWRSIVVFSLFENSSLRPVKKYTSCKIQILHSFWFSIPTCDFAG